LGEGKHRREVDTLVPAVAAPILPTLALSEAKGRGEGRHRRERSPQVSLNRGNWAALDGYTSAAQLPHKVEQYLLNNCEHVRRETC
jgi:hypothetical protein